MRAVAAVNDEKIIHQRAISPQRLSANARLARHQIVRLYFGHQLLQTPNKSGLAERTIHFLQSFPKISRGHFPEAGEEHDLRKISKGKICPAITFAFETQHSIGSSMDGTIDHAREVDAKERKIRVGDWIDQAVDEITALRREFIIFAAEGHDAGSGIQFRHSRDSIAMKPRAVNDKTGLEFSGFGLNDL